MKVFLYAVAQTAFYSGIAALVAWAFDALNGDDGMSYAAYLATVLIMIYFNQVYSEMLETAEKSS